MDSWKLPSSRSVGKVISLARYKLILFEWLTWDIFFFFFFCLKGYLFWRSFCWEGVAFHSYSDSNVCHCCGLSLGGWNLCILCLETENWISPQRAAAGRRGGCNCKLVLGARRQEAVWEEQLGSVLQEKLGNKISYSSRKLLSNSFQILHPQNLLRGPCTK